ncbi:MAG: S8 family serine peptidase [Trueperaceae bacterium]|nr:S8 family serine peptidase [Trueperaceae bacterium]
MHSVVVNLRFVLLVLLIGVLSACSTSELPTQANEPSPSHLTTVQISAADTRADVEARYGGSVLVFRPEAGFAILGLDQEEGELSTLATETSEDAFSSPEVSASGYSAWAGGFSAWAGGWSAWAGGWSAWAGGSGTSGPNENNNAWQQIKLKEAHAVSRNFGDGVKVAVIDTGFDLDHPVLANHLAPRSEWKDFIDNDDYPAEPNSGRGHGHGTAVAGIVLQVAPKATILPIRVLESDGTGDLDDVIAAIDYAISQGARVINLSLGTNQWSNSLYHMLYLAKQSKVYVVASAGNSGQGLTYPGNMSWYADTHPYVASVGSVDANGVVSDFSSYQGHLYALAPGEAIASAFPGKQRGAFRGTSFAAPMVSGALALAIGEDPSYSESLIARVYQTRDSGVRDRTLATRGFDLWQYTTNNPGVLDVEKLIREMPNFKEPVYTIKNVKSNKCLDVSEGSQSDGASIIQWACSGSKNQQWKLEVSGDYFELRSLSSDKLVSVSGASKNSGANIDQWTDVSGANQQWALRGAGTGFEIIAKHSNKCIDVAQGSTKDGANVIQWACHGGRNQAWRLELSN